MATLFPVAPHAGAWIETTPLISAVTSVRVAPHAGAWIETLNDSHHKNLYQSHPMRVRGLKHKRPKKIETIKPSHPMRVRGLKLCFLQLTALIFKSHPMRVRGLKLLWRSRVVCDIGVAPHAGAWIETVKLVPVKPFNKSHPMRVRGLKLMVIALIAVCLCRTPCGCVD